MNEAEYFCALSVLIFSMDLNKTHRRVLSFIYFLMAIYFGFFGN